MSEQNEKIKLRIITELNIRRLQKLAKEDMDLFNKTIKRLEYEQKMTSAIGMRRMCATKKGDNKR